MANPWEKYASPAPSGPWAKYQQAPQVGSEEMRAAIEDAGPSLAHAAGATARPWGPLGAAMAAGAAGGGALGVPGGLPGIVAGAGTGAGMGAAAYGAAHLADIPFMAVNGIGALFGHNPELTGPGEWFDNKVNTYINPLPEPSNKTEQYLAAASGGVKDAVAGNRMGVFLEGNQALRPVFQSVGKAFAEAPAQNAALGATAGVGGQFGSDATDGSKVGTFTGAILPVAAAVAGRGAIRGAVNTLGKDNIKAFGRGLVGRGEDYTFTPGAADDPLEASWGLAGARREVARQIAQDRAAQNLQGLAGSEAQRVAAANEMNLADAFTEGGFQPTAGSLSQNQGLLMGENALFQRDPLMRARYEQNRQAITQSADNALAPKGTSIQEGQGIISRFLGNLSRSAERNAQNFEDVDMNRANTLLEQKQSAVSVNRPVDQQTSASIQARGTAGNMMADEQAAYKKLYNSVPQDTPISFNNTIEEGLNALKEHGANAAQDPSIASAQSRIKAIIESRAANPEQPFSELQSDLKIVNSLKRQAYESGQKEAERLYAMVKSGLERDLAEGGNSSAALKKANAEFAKFKQRWSDGAAGSALDDSTPASATMDKYMATPEGAQQFKSTVGATPSGQAAAGQYLASKVARGAGQTPTKQSVTSAIESNKALSTFPEVKAAEEAKARQIGAATTFKGKQAGKLEQLQSDAAAAKDQATKSLPAKFANGSEDAAVSAVSKAFASDDPTSAFRELRRAAGRADKDGKAMDALRNATRKALADRLFNAGAGATTNEVRGITNADKSLSKAKTGSAINENEDIFKHIKGLLPDEEIKNLQLNYRRLEMSDRVKKAGGGQSTTAFNEADKSVIDELAKGYTNLNPVRAFKTAKTILQDLKTIGGSAFVDSKVNSMIQDTVRQAYLDPKKMSQLLLRPTEQNWERTKWARQQMNVILHQIKNPDEKSDQSSADAPAAPAQAAPAPTPKPAARKMRWNPKTGKLERVAEAGNSNRELYPDLYA